MKTTNILPQGSMILAAPVVEDVPAPLLITPNGDGDIGHGDYVLLRVVARGELAAHPDPETGYDPLEVGDVVAVQLRALPGYSVRVTDTPSREALLLPRGAVHAVIENLPVCDLTPRTNAVA